MDEPSRSLRIISWNLYNFGKSKDQDEILFIARRVKNFDIIAIQEISVSDSGPWAIARLTQTLNGFGYRWDYAVSEPTKGKGPERYAFIWKASRVRLRDGFLITKLNRYIDREPFMGRFYNREGRTVSVVNYHAVPATKKPAKEIVHLGKIPGYYPKDNFVVLGDFNLHHGDKSFDSLKRKGFEPTLDDQRTSLRTKETSRGDYLMEPYDNVLYDTDRLDMRRKGYVDFVKKFKSVKEARTISDHLPVWITVNWHK